MITADENLRELYRATFDLYHEAQTEKEALRAENERLRVALWGCENNHSMALGEAEGWSGEVKRLRDENERLRAGFQAMQEGPDRYDRVTSLAARHLAEEEPAFWACRTCGCVVENRVIHNRRCHGQRDD